MRGNEHFSKVASGRNSCDLLSDRGQGLHPCSKSKERFRIVDSYRYIWHRCAFLIILMIYHPERSLPINALHPFYPILS